MNGSMHLNQRKDMENYQSSLLKEIVEEKVLEFVSEHLDDRDYSDYTTSEAGLEVEISHDLMVAISIDYNVDSHGGWEVSCIEYMLVHHGEELGDWTKLKTNYSDLRETTSYSDLLSECSWWQPCDPAFHSLGDSYRQSLPTNIIY